MSRSLVFKRLAVCSVLLPSGVVSAAVADEAVVCSISAWVADTDSNGTNVRAGASRDAAILGQLPRDEYYFPAEVSITGGQNGWFRISKAVLDDYTGAEPKVVFEGEGWVSGRLLGLLLNDAHLHASPSAESSVVAHLSHEDADGNLSGADSFIVTRVIACQGDWVQVEGTFVGADLTGWATRTCSNQVTTCP